MFSSMEYETLNNTTVHSQNTVSNDTRLKKRETEHIKTLHRLKRRTSWDDTNDSIYSDVIMAKPMREFTWFMWWMQTEHQAAANPQTKLTDRLGLWFHL